MPSAQPVKWAKQKVKISNEGKVVPVALLNTLARPLGVEIEMCRVGAFDPAQAPVRCHLTRDGSVNGDASELVVNPYAGDAFVGGLVKLWQQMMDAEVEVDESCGYHVHVAAGDLGYFEIRRLVRLVMQVERGLYQCVREGRGRVNTHHGRCYCVPLKGIRMWEEFVRATRNSTSHTEIKDQLLRRMYGVTGGKHKGANVGMVQANAQRIAQKKGHKYEECRYYGLNLHTFMMRGTVEFRQCEGTLNIERLVYWPLLCGWVVEAATQLTDTEVDTVETLTQLVEGEWKRTLGKSFRFPKFVAEWVRKVRRDGE